MTDADGAVSLGDLSYLADGELRAFPDLGRYGIVADRVAGACRAAAQRPTIEEALV